MKNICIKALLLDLYRHQRVTVSHVRLLKLHYIHKVFTISIHIVLISTKYNHYWSGYTIFFYIVRSFNKSYFYFNLNWLFSVLHVSFNNQIFLFDQNIEYVWKKSFYQSKKRLASQQGSKINKIEKYWIKGLFF